MLGLFLQPARTSAGVRMRFRSKRATRAAISSALTTGIGIQGIGSRSDGSVAVLRISRAAASAVCCSGVTPVQARPL